MGLLNCNLRVSWQTQLISGVFYSVVIIAILLIPWPEQDWPIWLTLVILITLEAVLSQKRIAQNKGQLTLLKDDVVYWAEQEWTIIRRPFVLSFGMFLLLRSELSGEKESLWIAADSMEPQQWRGLCYEIAQNKK